MVSGQSSRESDGKRRRLKVVTKLVLLLLLEPNFNTKVLLGEAPLELPWLINPLASSCV